MNNSTFRAIPEDSHFSISFSLDEKHLLEWLETLSEKKSKEACFQLLRFLQTFNKTALVAQERRVLLIIVEEYLRGYINHLHGVCWDVGYPLTIDEKVYSEIVTWNFLLLSQGFFIVAKEELIAENSAISLSKALQAKGQAQLHIAAVYSLPANGFWRETYQMFTLAHEKQLLDIKVRKIKQITLETLFKKLFIFQACDTNQFHARDIQTIFYFLDNVCSQVSIKKKISPQELNTYFLFDLASDQAPTRCHQASFHDPSTPRYYFSPIIVAREIYTTLKKEKSWKGKLKPINSTLFSRVIRTLGLGQRRKYTRIPDEYDVSGIIGFDDIVDFLRTPSLLLAVDESKKKPTEALKIYIQNKELGLTIADEKELSEKMSYESIWNPPKSVNHQHIKEVNVKKIHIFNSSVKGYLAYWDNANTNMRAKVGDVFGLISQDKKRLEIALIRRISVHENNHYRFGVEVIGFESEVAYICHPNNKETYIWAIFIPGIKVLGTTDSLIFSSGSFKMGDKIHIYRGKHKIRGLMLKELHSTSGIILGELGYLSTKKIKSNNTNLKV